MLDTAERKMFTNSASVTADYGKTFQNQIWPLAKERGGGLGRHTGEHTGEHRQGMGQVCVHAGFRSDGSVRALYSMVQDDPLLPDDRGKNFIFLPSNTTGLELLLCDHYSVPYFLGASAYVTTTSALPLLSSSA